MTGFFVRRYGDHGFTSDGVAYPTLEAARAKAYKVARGSRGVQILSKGKEVEVIRPRRIMEVSDEGF